MVDVDKSRMHLAQNWSNKVLGGMIPSSYTATNNIYVTVLYDKLQPVLSARTRMAALQYQYTTPLPLWSILKGWRWKVMAHPHYLDPSLSNYYLFRWWCHFWNVGMNSINRAVTTWLWPLNTYDYSTDWIPASPMSGHWPWWWLCQEMQVILWVI
jgi:hypothetical protein